MNRLLTPLFILTLFGATLVEAKPIEIKADKWLNAPSVRIPDDRDYVLFFFNTFQAERETVRWIAELNKLQRKRRDKVVVIGLSAEDEVPITKFAKKHKVRFTVGIHSRAYRDFKIKRVPYVVKIEAERPVEIASTVLLGQWFPGESAPVLPEWPDTFDESLSVEALRQFASRTNDYGWDGGALALLRTKMPSDAFMKYCDELLASNPKSSRRGRIKYEKHLADPEALVKEPKLSPSSLARNEQRENPHDPKWQPANEYFANFQGRSASQLYDDYMSHMSDDQNDLLIRQGISGYYEHFENDKEARSFLMGMLPVETDAGCRMRLAGAFTDVCNPGDFEAAEFLEQQLAKEQNIRYVRPMMEWTIQYLRTGDWR